MFEHLDELKAYHAAVEEFDLSLALEGMALPVHPGAQRYYDAKGVK